MELAKIVLSDRLGLEDFPVRLVNFIHHLSNVQVTVLDSLLADEVIYPAPGWGIGPQQMNKGD